LGVPINPRDIISSPTGRVVLAAAVVFALYLPLAVWLRNIYVPAVGPPGSVLLLSDIHKLKGFSYRSSDFQLRGLADDPEGEQHSPVVLYEDDKPLGPQHSEIADIEQLGSGRYTQRKRIGFVFSASDNSDPRKNGRKYWAGLPPP
jgi:hypothetical protein